MFKSLFELHQLELSSTKLKMVRSTLLTGAGRMGFIEQNVCICAHLLQLYLTLWDPMDYSPPGSSVHGVFLAKNSGVSCHALLQEIFWMWGSNLHLLHCGWIDFLPLNHWGSPFLNSVSAKSLQSCPTLCNPMDCSPPSSSAHGILQVRILKWVTMPSFRGSFQPRDWTHVSYVSCTADGFFTTEPLGKPFFDQMGKQSKIFIWLITN